jgi:hypothetical protein
VSRFLCSELVTLRRGGTELVVNLEEIGPDGALVEADETLASGEPVELQCGEHRFPGAVQGIEPHDFGCRVDILFEKGTGWRPEMYRPHHLIDPEELRRKANAAGTA